MTWCKGLEYLVMAPDFSNYIKVKITIIKYTNSNLNESPRNMDSEAVSPADNHLFEVQDYAEDLTPEEQNIYGTFVAKILFLCCRDRPDIQLDVEFLITRLDHL